jgi:serine/threonine-protein kinase
MTKRDPEVESPSARGHTLEAERRELAPTTARAVRPGSGEFGYVVLLATALVLMTLGVWMHVGIKQSLREMRAAELQTVLDAEVQALQIWIKEKLLSAQRRAADPRVRTLVGQLVAIARDGPTAVPRLCGSPARAQLIETLRPFWESEEGIAINAIDRTGLVIATPFDEYCGRRVSLSGFFGHLDEVFRGQGRFVRPHSESQRLGDARALRFPRPLVWIEAPVLDARGSVIAALGFGEPADATFAHILRAARLGDTGEAYAFDESGLMLSESRFLDELKALGLISGESGATGILTVQLRDPLGGESDAGAAETEPAARPLTRLVARAVASRFLKDPAQQRGVILDPYRSYRGTEVVGAWRWLPELELGVAVEVAAAEAYAPLDYLYATYWALFGALVVAVIVALVSSSWVARLRLQVGEAKRIGPYTIEKQIGEGGMATVYLARHALLKRPTAIKILKPHMATDEILARFRREVEFAAQLSHPNNIEIYDYGRTRDGVFYYAMEYLAGITLAELVAHHGPVPPARTVYILRQICAALKEVHDKGLIHRDIKPENIMLCQRGGERDVVKVLDFGIVKKLDGSVTRDLTRQVRVLGTPAYMAPERLRDPTDVDARADIYAVGAVAYFLLTGHRPFEGGTDEELAQRIAHVPATHPSEILGSPLPRELEDLVLGCLAKNRGARPQSAGEMIATLDVLIAHWRWTQAEAEAWWSREGASPREAPALPVARGA